MQLDDGGALDAVEKSNGVSVVVYATRASVTGQPANLRQFASELQYLASSEYDMPFSIRGACGRVALRILRQVDGR